MKYINTIYVFVFAIICGTNAYSQITSSSIPDNYLDIHNYCYTCSTDINTYTAETINCDMIESIGFGHLAAFAYTLEDYDMVVPWDPIWGPCFLFTLTPTKTTGIHVEGTNTSYLFAGTNKDLCLPNASEPDIVIGDDIYGPGFYLGVVYNNTSNGVEIANVPVSYIASSGAVLGSLSTPVVLNDMTNGRTARNPHIDLFGDINTTRWAGNIYALHKFIATWTEYDPISKKNYIMAALGEIDNPSSFSRYQITPNNITDPQGVDPDVAAMGILHPSMGGSTDMAFITYTDPSNSNDLMLSTLDISGTTVTSISHTTVASGHTGIYPPRIESKTVGDIVSGEATYQIAASIQPSNTNWEINTFNDAASPTVLAINSTDNHYSAAVAGVGEDMDNVSVGNIGETHFSVAYYSTYTNGGSSNGDIYTNSIDISGGSLSTSYPNYYETDYYDLFQSYTYGQPSDIPVAISSSSNNGNGLLIAWFQGYDPISNWGEIQYRIDLSNTYSFKPSNIEKNEQKNVINIYPNPVDNYLKVIGINNTQCSYNIINLTGQTIYSGTVSKDMNSIFVGNLAPGLYILDITSDGASLKKKFVKQ